MALRVVAASGALPATVVSPSSRVWRAATAIAIASSWPGSQSRMIETVGDMRREHATVTLRRVRWLAAAVLCTAAAGGLGACSSSAAGDATAAAPATSTGTVAGAASTSAATTIAPTSTAPTSTAPTSTPATTAPATSAPATSGPAPTAATAPVTTIPPSPTGVPGIDVPDEFCAAWSRYSGSLQIIAVAVNFAGLTSAQSAALELEAAPTIVGAADLIDRTWPAALEAEHAPALDAYVGPFARRAAKAVDALRGAGAGDDQLAALRTEWERVLATRDPDRPTVDVTLPADLAARVDAGATAFDAAVTPWGSDPSLAVDLDAIPQTKRYLAEHCPDLASIGVGDDA